MVLVHADEDFIAVEFGRVEMVGNVSEHSAAQRKIGWRFQIQQFGQYAPKATGIQNEFRLHLVGRAFFGLYIHQGLFTSHIHGGHGVAVANVCAIGLGLFGQNMVERRAFDLPRGAWAGGEFVGEVKMGALVAAQKSRAVFELETKFRRRLIHRIKQTRFF